VAMIKKMKGSSSKSWNRRGEEGARILLRNSTLDVEVGEGNGGKMSGSKCDEAGEGES